MVFLNKGIFDIILLYMKEDDDMAKKPYNISSKAPTKSTKKAKRTTRTEKLESTTRIRIDKERLEDTSSLDTSFLEGRVDAQSRKKILNSKPVKKKSIDLSIIRNVILMVAFIVLLVFAVLGLMKHSTNNTKPKTKTVTEEKIIKVADDNYLFVGDYHTNNLNFDELDFHYTKISDNGYITRDVLDSIDNIYRNNPSKVFIELGMNDLNRGLENTEIITNLSEIIDGIKKNRTSAKIYVESLYPISTDNPDLVSEGINNERIIELNGMIKELANDKKVGYIDVFRELAVDDKLNDEYTENGLDLNMHGNEALWNLLSKVVDKDVEKD